jgi:Ser/Thr protein kinase RdoA (MazF antagonist)
VTPDALMPADMRRWLTGHMPTVDAVQDVSWARDSRKVWRVHAGSEVVYLKRSSTPDDHTRETRAYQHADRFAPHEMPRVLASDPDLLLTLTTEVPGQIVRELRLTTEIASRVHELAGRLLRRWHDVPEPPAPGTRHALAASIDAQATEAAAMLATPGGQFTDAARVLVRQVAEDLPRLVLDLPVVWLHGDYSTRNWLWDAPNGSHGLIDFEKAGHGLAVADLVWLHGKIWPARPDLRDAFLSGYGRALTDIEQRVLRLLTARLAASYLTTGVTTGDPVLVDRGRVALAHLLDTE